jgi:hypothetical protein
MRTYQEGEHLHDTGGGYTSHTESTSRLVETSCTWCNGSSSITSSRQRSVDEIVERSNGTIIRCPFSEFNQTHGPSGETEGQLWHRRLGWKGLRHGCRDLSQCQQVFLGRDQVIRDLILGGRDGNILSGGVVQGLLILLVRDTLMGKLSGWLPLGRYRSSVEIYNWVLLYAYLISQSLWSR